MFLLGRVDKGHANVISEGLSELQAKAKPSSDMSRGSSCPDRLRSSSITLWTRSFTVVIAAGMAARLW